MANFTADTTFVVEGDSVQFTDISENSPTSREWFFEGGTPETDTAQNPTIKYNSPGVFDVKLIVCNEFGSDTLVIPDYISVGYVGVDKINPFKIKVYPNPANEISNINYQINNIKYVKVSVLDMYGKEIRILVNEKQDAGKYTVQFNGSDLPAGIYLVRLQAGAQVEMAKVVIW